MKVRDRDIKYSNITYLYILAIFVAQEIIGFFVQMPVSPRYLREENKSENMKISCKHFSLNT